ncbi:MAG TPA: hypothetical protein VN043_12070 [Rhodanobacter sp.]|nr:hypothetical protein [Rhodanobacter sp.]
MNEFEWRRQLRDLRQPLTPQRDLWHAIDASLDAAAVGRADNNPPQSRRRLWLLGAGLAASVLLVAGIGWHLLQARAPAPAPIASSTPWKPADPRLAGAAIELDAARLELQLAIRQAPASAALQRLLDRTEQQQAQLRRLANQAS